MSVLTAKQARFVQEYLIDLNGKQAAIRTGYSAKTAESQASRLLRNAKVTAAVEAGQKKLAADAGVTVERIVAEYAKLGFSNMQDYIRVTGEGDAYVDLSALTREQAAAIGEVTVEDYKDGRGEEARDIRRVKFKLADKKGALDSLAKHLGMFVEKHVHTGVVECRWLPPVAS